MEIIVRPGDITLETTDAVVNAANSSLHGGGRAGGAIHRGIGCADCQLASQICAACRRPPPPAAACRRLPLPAAACRCLPPPAVACRRLCGLSAGEPDPRREWLAS